MYFPVGWPKVLRGSGATRGYPVKVFRHSSKDLVVELRSHSVAFWQARVSQRKYFLKAFFLINAHTTFLPQLCVQLSAYERSSECVEKHGVNVTAAIKSDGTVLVIAVSSFSSVSAVQERTFLSLQTSLGNLLFLRLQYERASNLSTHNAYSTREHGM